MKTQLRYELDKNRILKNKISQLKEEGRKLLLLYHTHFKGLDADDDDQIKEEKMPRKKKSRRRPASKAKRRSPPIRRKRRRRRRKSSKKHRSKGSLPLRKLALLGALNSRLGF